MSLRQCAASSQVSGSPALDASAMTNSEAVNRACGALDSLTPNAAPRLRVVLLSLHGRATDTAPPVLAKRLQEQMTTLTSRGIAVVCEARGQISGGALLLCAAAHYRIADTTSTFTWTDDALLRQRLQATLHPADAAAFAAARSVDAQ